MFIVPRTSFCPAYRPAAPEASATSSRGAENLPTLTRSQRIAPTVRDDRSLDRPTSRGTVMTIAAADAEFNASAAAAVALAHAASRGAGNRSGEVREGRETGAGLDPVELARVDALSARDKAVRAHEAAHVRVAGRYAGAPSFSYETGPDGRRYAVAGRVRIDVSAIAGDPRATLDKMRVVRAAALAPADPSPADLEVAALAERVMRAAQAELAAARLAEFARAGVPGGG